MIDSYIIDTQRLYLRAIDHNDLEFLVKLHQDPEVMRYIGPPRSVASVRERITRIKDYYQYHPGYGIWMACLKASSVPIGWACLKDLDGSTHIEVGYRLATSTWGNGYATELARALVHYGFEKLALPEITAVTHPDNLASQRVLEKSGFILRGRDHYYNAEVNFFSQQKANWYGERDQLAKQSEDAAP